MSLAVLAAAARASKELPTYDDVEGALQPWLSVPHAWPTQPQVLDWCAAAGPALAFVLLAGGAVYLAWGWTYHRLIMSLNAAVLGAWLGGVGGAALGAAVPGLLIGGFVGGLLAWPMLKGTIAVVAALTGFGVGAMIWQSFGLAGNFTPAGGLIGLTFLCMLTFVVLRSTVAVSTSVQGAAMLLLGALALAMKYPSIGGRVAELAGAAHYAMPLAVVIPATLGVVYQLRMAPPPAVSVEVKK